MTTRTPLVPLILLTVLVGIAAALSVILHSTATEQALQQQPSPVVAAAPATGHVATAALQADDGQDEDGTSTTCAGILALTGSVLLLLFAAIRFRPVHVVSREDHHPRAGSAWYKYDLAAGPGPISLRI